MGLGFSTKNTFSQFYNFMVVVYSFKVKSTFLPYCSITMEIVHFQQRNKYISKSKRKSPVPCPSFYCDYRAVEPKTMKNEGLKPSKIDWITP